MFTQVNRHSETRINARWFEDEENVEVTHSIVFVCNYVYASDDYTTKTKIIIKTLGLPKYDIQ